MKNKLSILITVSSLLLGAFTLNADDPAAETAAAKQSGARGMSYTEMMAKGKELLQSPTGQQAMGAVQGAISGWGAAKPPTAPAQQPAPASPM